ncbi:MAG: hypothetical protein FWE65_03035, partial [Eggerthellaceae bacterium]|nr:hypothetical protein [Eggerthellaceae bacterium]
MRIRYYVLTLAAVLVCGIGGIAFLFPAPEYRPDLVQINDVTATLAQHFDQLESSSYLLPKSDYDYVVIDANGKVLRTTRAGLSEDVYTALKRGDM